jgi:endoglucanase
MMNIRTAAIILAASLSCLCAQTKHATTMDHGGIIRGDTTQRTIHLVFTADGFGDGADTITAVLARHRAHASFFFTGNFYRMPSMRSAIRTLKREGHYLGSHSDKHLLYAPWENRDSLLVTKKEFMDDCEGSYRAMKPFGITKITSPYFLPPYEWHNDSISAWCREAGLTLVNYTPGTRSNADYTVPEEGNYVPSDTIYAHILAYEAGHRNGLNGFILLMHFGTDPHRTDKMYNRLDALMNELEKRGYRFTRVLDY